MTVAVAGTNDRVSTIKSIIPFNLPTFHNRVNKCMSKNAKRETNQERNNQTNQGKNKSMSDHFLFIAPACLLCGAVYIDWSRFDRVIPSTIKKYFSAKLRKCFLFFFWQFPFISDLNFVKVKMEISAFESTIPYALSVLTVAIVASSRVLKKENESSLCTIFSVRSSFK